MSCRTQRARQLNPGSLGFPFLRRGREGLGVYGRARGGASPKNKSWTTDFDADALAVEVVGSIWRKQAKRRPARVIEEPTRARYACSDLAASHTILGGLIPGLDFVWSELIHWKKRRRKPRPWQKMMACSPFLGPVIMGVTCSFIQ